MRCFQCRLTVAAAWCLLSAPSAPAYVDLAPTLARIVRESQTISVVEVDRFSRDKGVVVLKKVRDLKGETGTDPIKHEVIRAKESGVDRAILEWAEPGCRGVAFVNGKTVMVCLGEDWYQAHAAEDGWWRLGAPRPDLPLAYYGTVSRLADAIPLLLADKNAVITTLTHGADREGASFDLALNRASLPGLVRVQRLSAGLRMPDVALGVGANPAFVLGTGRAGADEIAALVEKLQAADGTARAETAADLGSLGTAAAAAGPELVKLLDDDVPRVRMAAAAALLRIKPKDTQALDILAKGFQSENASTRRHAARAAGLAGPAGAPLAGKLAALLKDPDVLVRRAALQAVATLGPAAAEAVAAERGTRGEGRAEALLKKIVAGTAGNVPAWGYNLLARFPEESLAVLTPGLAAKDLATRERAAVALGYIGRPAAAAKLQVALALQTAGDEREQRLLKWCLRQLD